MTLPRCPRALGDGAVIGVTAPSSGVAPPLVPRLERCEAAVRARGFSVRRGRCLLGDGIVSAPAQQRAEELMRFLVGDGVDAVVPPWGGELLIEILPLLDFERLAEQTPRWFAGWSDGTTLMLPLLVRSGWMSLHGQNLMDAAYAPPPGAFPWWELLRLAPGASFRQRGLSHYASTFRDYVREPGADVYRPEVPTRWRRLGEEGDVVVSGRLVGGCLDVISRLVGTPYGDVPRWARESAPEGTLVYLENCELLAPDAARAWHQLVMAGWFDAAHGVLVGRTLAADGRGTTQMAALGDALAPILARGVPVFTDVDIGHQPPQLLLVQRALARVDYRADGTVTLDQWLR